MGPGTLTTILGPSPAVWPIGSNACMQRLGAKMQNPTYMGQKKTMTAVTNTRRPETALLKPLFVAIGLNMVWINLSEVFRYFLFVMPAMRAAFPELPDVAPMSVSVFLIWGVWDTILVLSVSIIAWLSLERFGVSESSVVLTATGIWAAIFVILWLGVLNMNLATPAILLAALPLAWVEMIVAVIIVAWALSRTPAAIQENVSAPNP